MPRRRPANHGPKPSPLIPVVTPEATLAAVCAPVPVDLFPPAKSSLLSVAAIAVWVGAAVRRVASLMADDDSPARSPHRVVEPLSP
jgi:hypothetical protein